MRTTEEFAGRVLADGTASLTVIMAALGDRLGLFRALAGHGPVTAADLAARTGLDPGYTAEWLSGMAAAGYLDETPGAGRYALPDAHVPVLARDDTPASLGSILQWTLGVAPALDRVADAFRTGAGVPPQAYGPDLLPAIERLGAPWYRHVLVPVCLPLLPGVHAALTRGADVADVGCGAGRAVLTLAAAYPESRFTGFDIHPPQIERARANAAATPGVTFQVCDAAAGLPGRYDVIFADDVLHDAADPLAMLSAIRKALRPDGALVCVEPIAADPPTRALYHAVSVLYCLSVARAAGGAGVGTLGLTESRLAELSAQAGFATVRRVPVDDPMHAVYEVRP
jgi:SAM-dependent methyltransferase